MKTCLVVDDSKVIRKVARHILETLNFEVSEAGDGREALDSCLASAPDVVLLDWNMPVMSGMDFLRALRVRVAALPQTTALPEQPASTLRAVALDMEKSAVAGDFGAVAARLPELELELGRLREAMGGFLGVIGPGPVTPT